MVGCPTAFVRLTGCPLRCQYCDTTYAFTGGQAMSVDHILRNVAALRVHHVTVTGGEPLAQKACGTLLTRLCDAGHEVSLETSGAMDVSAVDSRVTKVMDLKTPGSGEASRNIYENIEHLTRHDQVKYVLCDRRDYDWARSKLDEHQLAKRCEILLSPSYGELNPTRLAEWILEDRLPVRMQIQLHKFLWGDESGR